ncbi:MAG: aspartate--tRNA(Asn) ligase [Patescibacteria group bacterium]
MERTLIIDSFQKLNEKVIIKGWVSAIRDHGKIKFVDISDRSGILQTVLSSEKEVSMGDVLKVLGTIKKRPEKMVNTKIVTGTVELEIEKLEVLEKAGEFPFDMGDADLKVSLEILLDYRPLTLKHPKTKAIFKVQETIVHSFRETLKSLGFTEIFVPTLVPCATEGGAEVFKVDYYDGKAYLAQSPQLYKQIMVGVFERVFTIAHAYRAEPSVTTRHMSEYVSLDCEMGFIESFSDILDVVEIVVKGIFKSLNNTCLKELALYNAKTPLVSEKIPRIKMREAQEIILKRTGRDNTKEPDLSPEDEKEICQYSKEKYQSELIFITHYPTKKRPFYTYPSDDDPEYTDSFDLLGRGLEWITGGRRINNYNKLLDNIKKWGNKKEDFEIYLQAFKYGMPPEGGFAVGAERVTMQVMGLKNVREASLFPRDMQRVDIKISKEKKDGAK